VEIVFAATFGQVAASIGAIGGVVAALLVALMQFRSTSYEDLVDDIEQRVDDVVERRLRDLKTDLRRDIDHFSRRS
jgi:hypothetical protein